MNIFKQKELDKVLPETELKIKTNKEGFNVVDARSFHNYLGSKQQFADWIQKRIKEYGFVENEDFTSFHKIMKRETGATKLKEYAITLDMAKELAMVERTDKGRAGQHGDILLRQKNS